MAVHVVDHPLVRHKLGILRTDSTSTSEFRSVSNEIARLLIYEATKGFATEKHTVQGWAGPVEVEAISGKMVTIVPILRAGLGLVDGLQNLLPTARVGHIGMYRDEETKQPVEYYYKMPVGIEKGEVIVVDPMLATGGSAVDAISALKSRGCTSIRLMNLVAAPQGVAAVQAAHPDVDIYVAAVDECLNEDAYIVPGLGDAGDRIFGTK